MSWRDDIAYFIYIAWCAIYKLRLTSQLTALVELALVLFVGYELRTASWIDHKIVRYFVELCVLYGIFSIEPNFAMIILLRFRTTTASLRSACCN